MKQQIGCILSGYWGDGVNRITGFVKSGKEINKNDERMNTEG